MSRVAIETNGRYTSQAGISRYIRGLLHGVEQSGVPNDLTYSELNWPVENLVYRQPQRAIRTFYRELIWAKCVAPRRLRMMGASVLHSTGNPFVRPLSGMAHVVTLHDLALLRYPQRFRPWLRRTGKKRLDQVRRADRVICISQFTADEAMALLDIPASRIEVIWNGCDFHPNDRRSIDEGPPDRSLPEEFFLFVGSLEPGKNLRLLREAYLLAEKEGKALPPLVIVGARWEGVAREGSHPKEWHYLGRQPDEVLTYLYRRARALVFPSRYEGFGLPVAEAMALGCPVICSRVASLPEIGGDAVHFSEMSPGGYRQAIETVAQDAHYRETLIDRGREQAMKFSWRQCAEQTMHVYREVSDRSD